MTIELIKLYNRLVPHLTKPARFIDFGEVRREQADKLDQLLTEREWHAGPYLVSCFMQAHWRSKPSFAKLIETRYQRYYEKQRADAARWWGRLASEWEAELGPEIHRGHEIVKARFLAQGKAALCRIQPELGGGFNARSDHCRGCPERDQCRGGSSI